MIYTKKGDDGQTSLIGGVSLWKCDERVEAYGTVDELNSHVGLLRDTCPFSVEKGMLLSVQRQLFVIQSLLAAEHPEQYDFLPELPPAAVEKLETEIDRMEKVIPPFREFIVAGGHPLVSQCHVTRCVCRRAERRVVALKRREEIQPVILRYLNRLSDYLFVLARYLSRLLDVKEDLSRETL
jgi:cob(I)alamin adenosyltransferase